MTKKKTINDLDLRKALEVLFASEYINHHKLYFHNFIRGIFFGAGGVIGATVLIGLFIWVISLFDTLPFIGPVIENFRSTIEQN